jgi:hypothetical protein
MARAAVGERSGGGMPVKLKYTTLKSEVQMCMLTSSIQMPARGSEWFLQMLVAAIAETTLHDIKSTPEIYSSLLMIYSRNLLEGTHWTRMVRVQAGTAAGYSCPGMSLAGSSL